LKVLVTGGAGYIGSHTARVLRQNGHEALLYDNLSTGYEFLASGFPLIVANLSDEHRLRHALQGVDAVMHFAAHAYVGESVTEPRKYFNNNVRDGLTLLDAALEAGVRSFIFSSTCAVYGVPERMPISEDTPRQPVNPYGVSKMCFERMLEAYAQAYSFRYVALRYFNAAGADESGEIGECHDPETHLLPLALEAAAGLGPELRIYGSDYPTPDGTCIRDYIHVNDLAQAHILALEYLMNGGASEQFNVGTGTGHSVLEVVRAVEAVTGRQVPSTIGPRREGDPPALVAASDKLKNTLGWKPHYTDLETIVRHAWNFAQKQTVPT